jgi:hypothetical protein
MPLMESHFRVTRKTPVGETSPTSVWHPEQGPLSNLQNAKTAFRCRALICNAGQTQALPGHPTAAFGRIALRICPYWFSLRVTERRS